MILELNITHQMEVYCKFCHFFSFDFKYLFFFFLKKGPAPEGITNKIFENTKTIKHYKMSTIPDVIFYLFISLFFQNFE